MYYAPARIIKHPQALTPRELELVMLVGKAWSNRAIGEEMHLTPKSVQNLVHLVILKLGCRKNPDLHARVRLARWAWNHPQSLEPAATLADA